MIVYIMVELSNPATPGVLQNFAVSNGAWSQTSQQYLETPPNTNDNVGAIDNNGDIWFVPRHKGNGINIFVVNINHLR